MSRGLLGIAALAAMSGAVMAFNPPRGSYPTYRLTVADVKRAQAKKAKRTKIGASRKANAQRKKAHS